MSCFVLCMPALRELSRCNSNLVYQSLRHWRWLTVKLTFYQKASPWECSKFWWIAVIEKVFLTCTCIVPSAPKFIRLMRLPLWASVYDNLGQTLSHHLLVKETWLWSHCVVYFFSVLHQISLWFADNMFINVLMDHTKFHGWTSNSFCIIHYETGNR